MQDLTKRAVISFGHAGLRPPYVRVRSQPGDTVCSLLMPGNRNRGCAGHSAGSDQGGF